MKLFLLLLTTVIACCNSFQSPVKRLPLFQYHSPRSHQPYYRHDQPPSSFSAELIYSQSTLSPQAISFPSSESLLRVVKLPPRAIFSVTSSRMELLTRSISVIVLDALNKMNVKINKAAKGAAEAMETGWARRGYGGSFRRTLEVWIFVISYAFQYLSVQRLKKKNMDLYKTNLRKIAKILTNKILELGPTFIKLGQLLSTRIDLFPREFTDELSLLQDQVPGFSGDIAIKIIEKEFNKPIDQIFETFNRTPIAAASLGQVHIASLNGQPVAVKVQRQGLKELFDMDLKNIKVLAAILDKFDPKSDGAQRDWLSIYDESAKLLYKEIDYKAEALNSIRFKDNFQNVPWVKVPDVFLNLTSSRVVTMEYVPGIKINNIAAIDAAGIDRKLLAQRSAESYLTQLCRHGFFHCDPHPGNVACDAAQGGRLIYYDFGMMDELRPEVKNGLVNLIFGIYENDVKEVCNSLEQIEVLKRGVDRLSVEKIARFFLTEFANGIKPGEKWVSQLPPEQQKEIVRQRRIKLGADLFSVGNDVPFKFPPTFTFVFRAFTSLDGIGKGLDADYDLTRLAQPYLKELVDLRDGSATLSVLKAWGKKLGFRPIDVFNTVSQPRKVAHVDEVITKMEQGDLKLRVRVLESERAFTKMELQQKNINTVLLASSFLNISFFLTLLTMLTNNPASLNGLSPAAAAASIALTNIGNRYQWLPFLRKAAFIISGIIGLQIPIGFLRLKLLEKKFQGFEK